jgi:HAD superfamily hydrolase (TIGR01549 family)
MDAVLFDFQGTIATTEDPVEWVIAAALERGVALDRARATALADQLTTVGRIGGPKPTKLPPNLVDAWADRDLYPHAHRAAYRGLAATVPAGIDGFADALYARVLTPEGWRAYADTASTMAALRAAGVAIGVISNVAFDIRPICDVLGFGQYVDAWVLSFEVGAIKPERAIFEYACRELDVEPVRALMVGDTPADAGAVEVGCRALILPAAPPSEVNGLSAVLDLVTRGGVATSNRDR